MMKYIAHKNQVAAFFHQITAILVASYRLNVPKLSFLDCLINTRQQCPVSIQRKHLSVRPGLLRKLKSKIPAAGANMNCTPKVRQYDILK